MTDPHARAQAKSVELRAVVIRGDGRREDLGLISGQYRNPLRRLWWRLMGAPRANRRIRAANRHHKQGS